MSKPLPVLPTPSFANSPADDEKMLNEMTDRRCGPCQACCTAYGVKELRKPYQTPCQFQCPEGCSIYTHRPDTCRTFACAWRIGLGEDHDRPDLSGFLVTLEMPDGIDGPVYVDALELRPDVLNSTEGGSRARAVVRNTVPLAGPVLGGVRLYPHDLRQHCEWDPENNPAHRATFRPVGRTDGVTVYVYIGNRPPG